MRTKVEPHHVLMMLLIFWFAWLWTEWTEYSERADFFHEVDEFMNRGDRFTSEDGRKICERMKEIDGKECTIEGPDE